MHRHRSMLLSAPAQMRRRLRIVASAETAYGWHKEPICWDKEPKTNRSRTLMALMTALVVAAPLAWAQVDAQVARGKAIAEEACAGCHAIDGGQGSAVRGTPAPTFRAIAGRPGTAERLQDLVTTPPHPMPAIPLTQSEVNAVVAFIRSLQ
jgi:mono/diheme cytochrome c family protein